MTYRPDRPMSSEEMLEQARRTIRERDSPAPIEDGSGFGPSQRQPDPTPRRAAAARARNRPLPPPVTQRPQVDPDVPRRAIFLVAIAISLVIAGFVAAIVFAQAGV